MNTTRHKQIRERVGEIEVDFNEPKLCDGAKEFSAWVDDWLFPKIVTGEPDVVTINQAKIVLTDHYRTFRNKAKKSCRQHCSDRGHFCLYHVWDRAYERLKALELRVAKPVISKPPKPKKPPPPKPDPRAQIGGIILGLED